MGAALEPGASTGATEGVSLGWRRTVAPCGSPIRDPSPLFGRRAQRIGESTGVGLRKVQRPAEGQGMKLTAPMLLVVLVSGCAAPAFDVAPRYGSFDLQGHFGITSNATGEVPVSDMSQAGIGKDDGFFGLKAEIDAGAPVFTLSTQQTDHGGSGFLGNDLMSGSDLILAGTAVDSDVSFGLHQFAATFDFVPGDMFDVGAGLGVTIADLDAVMTGGGDTIQVDRTLPIPVLALRAKVDLGDFEATGMISGLEMSFDGDKVDFVDFELAAQYRLFGGDDRLAGSIGAGYRVVNLGLDYEDDGDFIDTRFRFRGPYVAFIFGF